MTCTEASRLIGPWVDDELEVRSAMEVEGHVSRCAECGRERDELLALRDTARERLPREELTPQLEERLWKGVGRKTLLLEEADQWPIEDHRPGGAHARRCSAMPRNSARSCGSCS